MAEGRVRGDEVRGVTRDQNMKGLVSHCKNFVFCTERCETPWEGFDAIF